MYREAPLYRIEVRGRLESDWSEWFEGLTVEVGRDAVGGPVTVISGRVRDQAALQGILTRVWNLNLPLLTVTCLLGYGRHPDNAEPSPTAPEEEQAAGS